VLLERRVHVGCPLLSDPYLTRLSRAEPPAMPGIRAVQGNRVELGGTGTFPTVVQGA